MGFPTSPWHLPGKVNMVKAKECNMQRAHRRASVLESSLTTEAVFRAPGHLFHVYAPSCAVIPADSLWRAFELTSNKKKEILWAHVFSCLLHTSLTRYHLHGLALELPCCLGCLKHGGAPKHTKKCLKWRKSEQLNKRWTSKQVNYSDGVGSLE